MILRRYPFTGGAHQCTACRGGHMCLGTKGHKGPHRSWFFNITWGWRPRT